MLSHTHTPRREKHIENELILSITLWFQQLCWLCLEQWEMFGSSIARFSMCSSVWSKWVNSWDLTILKTIACWSSFLWQTFCCNLAEWCLAIFLFSLLPNEKNIEVQPEGLYYLWLIHFTVKSTLLYFQKFQRRHDKWSSGHSLMWLFSTENINKWFFLFEKIPTPYQ